jgi:hypothetical protein
VLAFLIHVNVFSLYTVSDNSVVVAVILLFIRCLCRIIPATKLLTYFLTFGDQISVVYHSISLLVCIVVSRGIFWSFQTRVVRENLFLYALQYVPDYLYPGRQTVYLTKFW